MKKQRKTYSSDLKVKIALAAIKVAVANLTTWLVADRSRQIRHIGTRCVRPAHSAVPPLRNKRPTR